MIPMWPAELEARLRKAERELLQARVDINRLWRAVPNVPDPEAGVPLTGLPEVTTFVFPPPSSDFSSDVSSEESSDLSSALSSSDSSALSSLVSSSDPSEPPSSDPGSEASSSVVSSDVSSDPGSGASSDVLTCEECAGAVWYHNGFDPNLIDTCECEDPAPPTLGFDDPVGYYCVACDGTILSGPSSWVSSDVSSEASDPEGTDYPTPLHHWRGEDLVESGGSVTSWPDHDGSVDLTSVSGVDYDATSFGGKPTAEFSDSTDYAENTSANILDAVAACTIAMVLKTNSDTAVARYLLTQDDSSGYRLVLAVSTLGQIQFYYRTNAGAWSFTSANDVILANTSYVIVLRLNVAGAVGNLTVDGVEVATVTPSGATLSTGSGSAGFVLGNWKSHTLGARGDIPEVAVWDTYLSDTDRAAFEAAMTTKYSL